jgi:hypothetical protein
MHCKYVIPALALMASAYAFAADIPDSTIPNSLSPEKVVLKINEPVTAQTVFGNPKDTHKPSCTVKLSGTSRLDPTDELTGYDIWTDTEQTHRSAREEVNFSAANAAARLDLDCRFPHANVTVGDIRAVVGSAITIDALSTP